MSRCYGFKIVNYDCIPKDLRISTTLCYRDTRMVAFDAIRSAGVLLYEQGSMISFCEDEKGSGSSMAFLTPISENNVRDGFVYKSTIK